MSEQDKLDEAPDGGVATLDAPPEPTKAPDKEDRVAKLEAELEKVRHSYDELRSFNDRKIGALTEENALLKVIKDQMSKTEQREYDALSAKEQEDFDARVVAEIDENGGKAALKVFRGMIGESSTKLRESLKKEIREELMAEFAPIKQRVLDNDPDYQANKDLVDKLIAKGLSRESAVETAKEILKTPGVTYAGRAKAPGTVGTEGRQAEKDVPVEPEELDPVIDSIASMAGLDKKKLGLSIAKGRRGG